MCVAFSRATSLDAVRFCFPITVDQLQASPNKYIKSLVAWITEKSHTHTRAFIKGCCATNEAENPSSSDGRSIDGTSGGSRNIQRRSDNHSHMRCGVTAGATSQANYSTTDEAEIPSSSHGRSIDGTSEDSTNILRGFDSYEGHLHRMTIIFPTISSLRRHVGERTCLGRNNITNTNNLFSLY